MSTNQTESQEQKYSREWQQNMKKAQQNSRDYFSTLKKQIQIEDQKIKRYEQQKKTKTEKIFRKNVKIEVSQMKQSEKYEVPVDGELERGSKLFMIYCSQCHSLEESSDKSYLGPSLGLIHNRKIGSEVGYQGYSQALAENNNYWTSFNLYKFMFNPQKFIPGSNCKIDRGKGLESEEDRADILEFLKQYSHELSRNLRIRQIKAKGYQQFQTEQFSKQQTKI